MFTGVGKTSIVQRYVDKEFDLYHRSTIGASYFWCKINVDDVKVALHVSHILTYLTYYFCNYKFTANN